MFTIKFILSFIKSLNADASPRQIAGGMALGSILGITPAMSLHNLIVFVVILMIRVNFSAALFAWGAFALISYILDPLFNRIGYALLVQVPALQPLWTALYNTPAVPWTGFNNTLTLGSLVFALLFFWPLYFFLTWFVTVYRERIMSVVAKWKIVQILKASKLFGLYQSFS